MIYLWFVLGAVVGSFLNVCIHRLPRGESILWPPSRCPGCGAKLSPLDLVPIIGYFILQGKCRYCRAKISFRYPLVEILTALAFPLIWLNARGDLLVFVFQLIFFSTLLVIFFTDLEHQVIPDAVSITGIFSGLVYNYVHERLMVAIMGMLLGYLLLLTVGALGRIWFKKEAMGEGDLYVAALLGAYLGWEGVLLSIFLACLLAMAVSLLFLTLGKIRLGQYVPFGPALAAGGIATIFFGQQLIGWYVSLLFRT